MKTKRSGKSLISITAEQSSAVSFNFKKVEDFKKGAQK